MLAGGCEGGERVSGINHDVMTFALDEVVCLR